MTKQRCAMTKFQTGFTLIEAVMVIAITGIIGSMVAVFIATPVKGYFDSARRAELTDVADTAIRRISRDVHLALPNSVRLVNPQVIEFLQTRTGGRYRIDGTGIEDILDFTNPTDTTFDVLGPTVTLVAGDQIVIYNLGITGADAYVGNNRRAYNGAGGSVTNVPITSTTAFPLDSPGHRFQVVDTPVTYICNLGAGTLTRYWGYTIVDPQPNPPVGGIDALLAKNVSNCTFTYTQGVTERSGLVSIQLAITQDNETVSLYHAVQVSNVP